MLQKRIVVASECVPFGRCDIGNAVIDGDLHQDTVSSREIVEILLCVERRHTAGTGRSNGLAVDLICDVTSRKYQEAKRCGVPPRSPQGDGDINETVRSTVLQGFEIQVSKLFP